MACACKVNQDLTYLQKKYGVGGPKKKTTNITGDLINLMKDFFVRIVTILLFPLIAVFTTGLLIRKKGKIKITDLIGFRKLAKYNG